jgi:hypothetical protein
MLEVGCVEVHISLATQSLDASHHALALPVLARALAAVLAVPTSEYDHVDLPRNLVGFFLYATTC